MRKKKLTKSLLKKTLKVKQYVDLAPGYSDLCVPIFVENYKDDPDGRYYPKYGGFKTLDDVKAMLRKKIDEELPLKAFPLRRFNGVAEFYGRDPDDPEYYKFLGQFDIWKNDGQL